MTADMLSQMGDVIIPVLAIGAVVVLSVVKVMSRHQQAMARILNENAKTAGSASDIDAMRQDLRMLRDTVNQQSIALDNLRGMLATRETANLPPNAPNMEERLGHPGR